MAYRTRYESSSEIGIFSVLTNTYCLVGLGGCENFYSTFETHLAQHIPVVHCTISNTKIVGALTCGNKNGLLVPQNTNDTELQHLRNSLPEGVKIRKLDARISALGNCIAANDHVALIHPEFDKESEEIIADVLGVEVFKVCVGGNALVGTYSVFNNLGGVVTAGVGI